MCSGRIRCFVAVEIPTAVRYQLAKIQERNHLPELTWVKPENIHLTIKFLGDIWQSDQPKIEKSLTEIANQYRSFMIKIGSLGAFPNFFQPKVIWAGIEKIPLNTIKNAPRYATKFKYSLKNIIPIIDDQTICK